MNVVYIRMKKILDEILMLEGAKKKVNNTMIFILGVLFSTSVFYVFKLQEVN
jgi:hypothetical protein